MFGWAKDLGSLVGEEKAHFSPGAAPHTFGQVECGLDSRAHLPLGGHVCTAAPSTLLSRPPVSLKDTKLHTLSGYCP